MTKRDWIWFGLSWLLFIFLVNPVGEFPLNDDWGYARVVWHLVAEGVYQPGDWPVMTLFAQVLWGALFAGIFGFSFTILRISTLVLAMLGSYWIFRETLRLTGDRFWARMALFTLVLNPLYFHLSFSFMTDVPFTVAVSGAVLLYRRALGSGSGSFWVLATVAVAVAALIRQPALLLAPAFGAILVLRQPGWRSFLWALSGLIFSYGAVLTYIHFLGLQGETPGMPDSLRPLINRIRFSFLWLQLQTRGGLTLYHLAVFLLPLLLLRAPFTIRQIKTRKGLIITAMAAVLTLVFAYRSWTGIPMGNIIGFFGLGPTTVFGPDNRYFDSSTVPILVWPLLKAIGFIVLFGFLTTGSLAIARSGHWRNWATRQWWKAGAVLFVLAYGLYLLVELNRFDRYQLVLLPLLILLLSPENYRSRWKWAKIAAVTSLVILGVFSIGGTRDYLAWNRVRWEVLNDLTADQGIAPEQIDGGLEFNGWYATSPQNPYFLGNKSWWFVADDQYLLSFSGEVPCAERSTPFPVRSWWPGKDTLYVHERPAVIKRDTISCDVEKASDDPDRLISNRRDLTFSGGRQRSAVRAHSGGYAWVLTPGRPYAGKLSLEPVLPCEQITISVWRWGNNRSAGIVAASPEGEDYHSFQNSFFELGPPDGWHRVRHEIRLPADYPSPKLDIYLWNPVRDTVWMDDMEVIWRRREQ